jgi:branched-chain amino acid transport system substrate-binding protein
MAVLALVVATLCSCAAKPVIIGFIGPMTGPTANIGVEGYRGFSLALAEVNEVGGVLGRKVEARMLDDAADPVACLAAARELVGQGVRLIVLHTISGAAAGALPWLLEQDVLVVTRTVSDPVWADKDDDFLRFVGSTDTFGESLSAFTRQKGFRSVAIIADARNKAYAESVESNFTRSGGSFETRGMRWVDAGFSHDETASWAVASSPEAVLAIVAGLDAAKLAHALDRQGFTGSLLLSPWSQDQNLLAYSGRLADRIYLSSSFNPDDASPAYVAMKARYASLYDSSPTMPGLFGYEIAGFLLLGIEDAGKTTPYDVKKALLTRRRFEGMQYGFDIDAEGDALMTALIITIKSGTYIKAP